MTGFPLCLFYAQIENNLSWSFQEGESVYYYDIKESGKRIKELRKARGLTQEKLAALVGISVQGYKNIEYGNNGASVDTLILLAVTLGTTIDYLVIGRNCTVAV